MWISWHFAKSPNVLFSLQGEKEKIAMEKMKFKQKLSNITLKNVFLSVAFIFVFIILGCARTEEIKQTHPDAMMNRMAVQRLIKGVEYAAQGKFGDSKEEFEKALKFDPFYESARELLKVIEDVNKRKIKINIAISFFKGVACIFQEQWDEGISELSKAIELDPRLALAYSVRGAGYFVKGQFDRAISDCTKAIELNPRYAEAFNNRGGAMFKSGNTEMACSDWKSACKLGDCRNYNVAKGKGWCDEKIAPEKIARLFSVEPGHSKRISSNNSH